MMCQSVALIFKAMRSGLIVEGVLPDGVEVVPFEGRFIIFRDNRNMGNLQSSDMVVPFAQWLVATDMDPSRHQWELIPYLWRYYRIEGGKERYDDVYEPGRPDVDPVKERADSMVEYFDLKSIENKGRLMAHYYAEMTKKVWRWRILPLCFVFGAMFGGILASSEHGHAGTVFFFMLLGVAVCCWLYGNGCEEQCEHEEKRRSWMRIRYAAESRPGDDLRCSKFRGHVLRNLQDQVRQLEEDDYHAKTMKIALEITNKELGMECL